MSVLTDLIDGTVEVLTAGGELAAAKIYSIAGGVVALMVLVFLLILFVVEPLSATILAVLLIVALVVLASDRGGGLDFI